MKSTKSSRTSQCSSPETALSQVESRPTLSLRCVLGFLPVTLLGIVPTVLAGPKDVTITARPPVMKPDRSAPGPLNSQREIVFVDASVTDPLAVMRARPGAEVVHLDARRSGIDQVTDWLARRRNVDVVHVVSHGGTGYFQLGSDVVTQEMLRDRAMQLGVWGTALHPDADLLVYGCMAGNGSAGRALLQRLSDVTGADVAGSVDTTAGRRFGGNWVLEQQVGAIEAAALQIPEYTGKLATFVVTATTDSGVGSLRQAVADAEAAGGADTITFDESIAGSLITLGTSDPDQRFGPTGLVIDNQDLTIIGDADAGMQLDADTARRVFAVSDTATLTLQNLTLSGGDPVGADGGDGAQDGGGGGGGAGMGGAILNLGTVTVDSCLITLNFAAGGAGGEGGSGGVFGAGGGGGGVGQDAGDGFSSGTAATSHGGGGGGTFGPGGDGTGLLGGDGGSGGADGEVGGGPEGGSATGSGGGGGGAGADGELGHGGAGGFGGGGGGASYSDQSAAYGGDGGFAAGGGGGGGGPSDTDGGSGGFGGGAGGNGGAVSSNAGVPGFGAGDAEEGIAGSGGGGAGLGAGIFNHGGSVTIINSTISDNLAVGGSGGVGGGGGYGVGGGVFNRNGQLVIRNSTIAGNTADAGAGVFSLGDGATADVDTVSSIFADGIGSADFESSTINTGTSNSEGSANIMEVSIAFAGDAPVTDDPQLVALADNGGPTLTHAIPEGSPAVDAGENPLALTSDQRGLDRVSGADIDIGAFELQVPSDTDTDTDTGTETGSETTDGGSETSAGDSDTTGSESTSTTSSGDDPDGGSSGETGATGETGETTETTESDGEDSESEGTEGSTSSTTGSTDTTSSTTTSTTTSSTTTGTSSSSSGDEGDESSSSTTGGSSSDDDTTTNSTTSTSGSSASTSNTTIEDDDGDPIDTETETDTEGDGSADDNCKCTSDPRPLSSSLWLALIGLLGLRRRRRPSV